LFSKEKNATEWTPSPRLEHYRDELIQQAVDKYGPIPISILALSKANAMSIKSR
jgi:hypothetical protein